MSGLRALHLFGNYKWTGPADPAIRCARGLRQLGADVLFAQARFMQGTEHRMAVELRRELLPVTGDLWLPKHYGPIAAWRDGRTLARRLRRADFDLLHANLLSDHIVASLAKRLARVPVTLVRTVHEPEAPPRNLRSRFAFANTDGVVVPTRRCAEQITRRFGLAPDAVHLQEPATDSRRFGRVAGDLRGAWGVGPEHFVIGITARVQPHRRFDLLWEVARAVVDQHPAARFVLLGRGHRDDERRLVEEPVARLGLRDQVVHSGYLYEPDFTRALKSLDLFLFLVPGSDATCRAVREALAAGVPVVATKRGILPDLLSRREEGPGREPCGLPVEEDAGSLSRAILRLIREPEARANLRAAALDRVAGSMDEVVAARRLLGFYHRLREARR